MTKQILFVGALCAFLIAGCNGGDTEAAKGGKNQNGGGTAPAGQTSGAKVLGGCKLDAQGMCNQVSFSGDMQGHEAESVANMKQNCQDSSGTFVSECPTAGALGGCRQTDQAAGGGTAYVTSVFYSGSPSADSAERVEQICAMMKGEFIKY
jgi:hypothetical protein